MEDQRESNQGAIIEQEKNLPHGLRENVPSRGGGVTEDGEEEHPNKPQDDLLTSVRRARYGEDPAFVMNRNENIDTIAWDVNQVMSRVNITRDQVLNSKEGLDLGSGRAMVQ
jgi:hypothetical protein